MADVARFIGVDTIMIDVVLKLESLPQRGSDEVVSERLITTGGGFNAMSAASRQGLSVVYAGQLGTGPFADLARADLNREGILFPIAPIGDVDLGICVVLVEDDGERTFVTSPGAEGRLHAEELATIELHAGDVVFLSGYDFVYSDLGRETLAWLHAIRDDVIVAFDPGPRVMDLAREVLGDVLARTDWLLCNANEAAHLSGERDAASAARALSSREVRVGVVVRNGADGCYLAQRSSEVLHVAGVPSEVIDTNGAGDVHNGVFLAEIATGTALFEALRRANVAASIAIGQLGPATSPDRDAVSKKMAELY